MKKAQFEIVDVSDEYIAVPTGDDASTIEGVVVLTEASAFLLRSIPDEFDSNMMKALLLDHYIIDDVTAEQDIDKLLKKLISFGLIHDN